MNSTQLTYGRRKDGSPNAIFDGLSRLVCSFPEISTSPYGGGDIRKGSPTTAATMEANARMFCAATELLAALKRLSFAASCRDNTSGDPIRVMEVRAELAEATLQAAAAIAKAEGGAA
jgi:hypothetical protein